MDKNKIQVLENQLVTDPKKNLGCWARFKSLFEDRGFDLEYEYNGPRTANPINLLGEDQNTQNYRRVSERKLSVARVCKKVQVNNNSTNNTNLDFTSSVNFYDQFTTLNDEETKEEPELWRKSVRHRVSIRPSAILTNIMEEDDDIELVSEH